MHKFAPLFLCIINNCICTQVCNIPFYCGIYCNEQQFASACFLNILRKEACIFEEKRQRYVQKFDRCGGTFDLPDICRRPSLQDRRTYPASRPSSRRIFSPDTQLIGLSNESIFLKVSIAVSCSLTAVFDLCAPVM